jgi:hypothetical protein
MAKAVADVTGENQGGYAPDFSNILGFSHMHDLGVGWVGYSRLSMPSCIILQSYDSNNVK